MKFTIKKTAFLVGLEKASQTVSSKDSEPLLKSFNVEADLQEKPEDSQIRILSTDQSLGTIAKIRVAEIEVGGATCMPAQKLLQIVKSAEDTDIEVTVADGQATIKAGRATWKVNVLESDEYPAVPRFNVETSEEVNREALLGVIGKVRYAASQEEVRASLMLIAFNGTRVATSDGYRLQWAEFKGLEGVQIPIAAVNNLVRLLNRTEVEKVRVEQQKNHLLFQIGADTFSTQRLFEEFPDVEKVILDPAMKNDKELTLDKEQLLAAINRVRISANEERKALDIEVLAPENGGGPDTVALRAVDESGETAEEHVSCTTTLEPGRLIIVNHQFFTDALTMNTEKQVTIKLGEDQARRRSSLLMTAPGLKSVLLQLRPQES